MALISVDQLAARLGPEGPVLLDVRWELGGPPGLDLYRRGHIPGAAFVDLDGALAGPPGPGGRHPLPAAEDFAAAMRDAGVSGSRGVVVYDAGNSIAAARAWWLLRYFGHGDVAVLDGGFAAWVAVGLAVATDSVSAPVPVPVPGGDFRVRPGGMPLLDAVDAASLARSGVLIDARTAERFRGEQEPVDPVAGHIPGAVNLPSHSLLDATGHFFDPAALRQRFEAAGAGEGVQVGAYCGSGITAAHEVLALEVAGFSGAGLYVGSWSEWITDPDRAVAVGG